MIRVRDVMTRDVHVCSADDTLSHAADMMRAYQCGVVPVVDHLGKGTILGMVTDRDICLAVAQTGRLASDILLCEVLSPHLHECHAGDTVQDALATMVRQRVRRLPVVTPSATIEGLLSIDDIVAHSDDLMADGVPCQDLLNAFKAILTPHHF